MIRTFIVGCLISIACGIIGTFIVVRRMSFLAGSIAHTVFGGLGLFRFLNLPPFLGAVVFSQIAAIVIGGLSRLHKQHEDILISAVWAIGMATGLLFLQFTPGYNVDLMSYLFGNILLVSSLDITLIVSTNLMVIISSTLWYRELQAICFDETHARIQGVRSTLFYLFLLCISALTIVITIRIVGIILVIALLTLPAATAIRFTTRLWTTMALSIALSTLYTTSGIIVSCIFPNLLIGPTIIIIAAIAYLLSRF